tara:strand:+ start:1537 stop:2181 length:645 start_codon:yes stop_codon:yes gene_type:complete
MVRCLELFSGTKSVGKCCEELGWETVSVDLIMEADHQCDIMTFDYKQYKKDDFDIIWASPPCTEYSKLQDGWLNRMRKGELYTKEIQEKHMIEGDMLIKKTLEIINYFNPEVWFMENPQSGRMKDRDIMKGIPFYDVDYCMYSDWGYRKRTRIWTNKKDWNNLMCNKQCGNMVGSLHKQNLGNSERQRKTNGNGTSQTDRYRVPPDLIYSLLLD